MMSSSSTTSSNATASRIPSFDARVQDVKLSKSHINTLVMDYLVMEGYPVAAQNFAKEANIQPNTSVESIQERVEIRNLIYKGDIESAVERINELNIQILDRDTSLHFALLRLQLVELIRVCISAPDGDIAPVLEFASTQLAPRAPTNPEFLQDLEQTMALLIFTPENMAPSLAALLDTNLRKDVANRVNEAILQSQGERTRSKLLDMVKTRAWAERKAREFGKDIPDHIDIGLDPDRGQREDSVMQGNGEAESVAI